MTSPAASAIQTIFGTDLDVKNEQASKRTRKKGYSSFPVIYPNKTYSRPFLQESNLPPPSTIEAETGRSPWNVRDIWTWHRGRSSRAEEKQIGSWRDNKWILRDSYRSMFFLRSFSFRFLCWREKFRDDISESSFKKKNPQNAKSSCATVDGDRKSVV